MKLDPMILAMLNSMAAPMMSRAPDQVIGRGIAGDDYMHRWFLARKLVNGPVENVYLHRFLRGDGDEAVHDHPWNWMTLILRGGYIERTPQGDHVRAAGDVVMKSAEDAHMILAVDPGTLTLFITGPKTREWGFHTPHGVIPEPLLGEYQRRVRENSASALGGEHRIVAWADAAKLPEKSLAHIFSQSPDPVTIGAV